MQGLYPLTTLLLQMINSAQRLATKYIEAWTYNVLTQFYKLL